jgi:pimeloyl-ACP methyl ester carboxylesterase
MKKSFSFFASLLLSITGFTQTNVRGWYADGQVWIVWQETPPDPTTYAIYASPAPFTTTSNAILAGRLFAEEWKPGALRDQIDPAATYRVPGEVGGTYQLEADEGLFVFTPHQSGSLYFAVVKWGDTTATAGVNRTAMPVAYSYAPLADPVECHLQRAFTPATGYTTLAFYMWADGRQNHWEGRPDFPIMANRAKNGMPSYFLVSAPTGLDTTGGVPAALWLHGGGGRAIQSLPQMRPLVNIRPEAGLLVAHNDDLFGFIGSFYPGFETVTWHFGWRKHYDPFLETLPTPVAGDTVINYTQRRYVWINDWLVRRAGVDPARINVNGHSMGGAGTTALAKAFPGRFASATIFNNGFDGPEEGPVSALLFGVGIADYPTSLRNRAGQVVPMSAVFNLTDHTSGARDWPVIRSFHGKNDVNATMQWDANVVAQYRAADSLGHGMALYWSERDHNIDSSPDFDDQWIKGLAPSMQTAVENVAYEEANFRADRSYPAFFNHRLDPASNDPGDGTPGTDGAGVGDDWGTWGGYHRWSDVEDTPWSWGVTAWLEDGAVFTNDNSPHEQLTADVAIRRPQQFKQGPGYIWSYSVSDLATGELLQFGLTAVGADSLVVAPGIVVYRENVRKVRILFTPWASAAEAPEGTISIRVQPNPARDVANLVVESAKNQTLALWVTDAPGRPFYRHTIRVAAGNNVVPLPVADWPAGLYLVRLSGKNGVAAVRLVRH